MPFYPARLFLSSRQKIWSRAITDFFFIVTSCMSISLLRVRSRQQYGKRGLQLMKINMSKIQCNLTFYSSKKKKKTIFHCIGKISYSLANVIFSISISIKVHIEFVCIKSGQSLFTYCKHFPNWFLPDVKGLNGRI